MSVSGIVQYHLPDPQLDENISWVACAVSMTTIEPMCMDLSRSVARLCVKKSDFQIFVKLIVQSIDCEYL